MAEAALVGLMVAGTAMNVVGNIRQGIAEREQGDFMAGQSRDAANRAEKNANLTLDAARIDERRKRQENAQLLGNIRAAFGANGMGVDGSAKDYLDYQASIAQENELDIRHEGVLKAMGYREEAKSYRSQAEQYKKTGANAFTSGLIGAGGALVKGGATIAGNYYTGGRATTASGAAEVIGLKRGGT